MMQPHLKIEKAEQYVLLSGDPDRTSKIAIKLEGAKEISNNRGLRICSGSYEGTKVTAATSGVGCPSAAIVTEELASAGAKTIIRIGTCGGLLKEMQPGDLIIPNAAFCGDGTTREYGLSGNVEANTKVAAALVKAAKKLGVRYFVGTNRTHDAFYEPTENFVKLAGKGFVSSEMECSAVFAIAKIRNIRAGAVLVVNTPEPPEEVAANPEMVYKLVDADKVSQGVDNAIKVALEAIKMVKKVRGV
jgi:purine-nucleoside phosphorylase